MSRTPRAPCPIAVVGASALFPGSKEPQDFWRNILEGKDLISEVPAHYWLWQDHYDPKPGVQDKTYCKRGGFLGPVEFDPLDFGIPPSALTATDAMQLLALVLAKRTLEDAWQGGPARVDRNRIAVVLGAVGPTQLQMHMSARLQRPVWLKALREEGLPEELAQAVCERILSNYHSWQESTFPGWLTNVTAGRICNRLDLGGANCTVDAACASSLAAVDLALKQLYLGDADMVLTGGMDTLNDPMLFVSFSQTPAFSPTQDCRPFAHNADGTVIGEGIGMVALRRLEDAEKDGDRIYAVLRGMGGASDGKAKSVYAPRAEGQSAALQRAYDAAGYGPETVDLVEAHGTGTAAGDAAEMEGLRAVFEACGRKDRGWCALGTVKSQIGHTKAAAGVAGLYKAVMALHHKVLPPTIKVEKPDPNLHLETSPFYLNTQTRPWIKDPAVPRRAGVSAFGFGGANYHAALEEYRGAGKRAFRVRTMPSELVLLHASSPDALAQEAATLAERVGRAPALVHHARRTQKEFDAGAPARLAIVATDETEVVNRLRQARDQLVQSGSKAATDPTGTFFGFQKPEGKLAFMFPGQSSHVVGMGADLINAFDMVRAVWDQAAALPLAENTTMQEMVFPRPTFNDAERKRHAFTLSGTPWAQPAVACVSLSQLALLNALGLKADVLGAHSYGDAVALHAAGVFDFPTLLDLTRRRGTWVEEAEGADRGSMTSVVLPAKDLRKLIEEWGNTIFFAGENTPGHTILAGPMKPLEAAERSMTQKGIKFRRLPIDGSGHTMLHKRACERWQEFMQPLPFNAPRLPVYTNSHPEPYPADPAAIKARLAWELALPVRFAEQLEEMYRAGVRTFLEVGPNAVLCGLIDLCFANRPHRCIALDRKGQHGLTSLWQALGQLSADGYALDYAPLWAEYAEVADPAARKKAAHLVELTSTIHGKAYPPAGGADALPKPNPTPTGHAAALQPAAGPAGAPLPAGQAAEALATLREMVRQVSATHESYQRTMLASLNGNDIDGDGKA